ncbi:MAG: site-specific integrase [Candidatus Melainabacteria bacterium]|jgi:site-specific recombinase XerD|nr:site-specific integrase [Candidatus Melainabacteria bacterium]
MERYFKHAAILKRMQEGPLGPYLDLLASQLSEQGYARATAQRHLSIAAGFSEWLRQNRVPISKIEYGHARDYIRQRSQRKRGGVATALAKIMNVLHEQGVVNLSPQKRGDSPDETLIDQYAEYLRKERGLSQSTIRYYIKIAEQFLLGSSVRASEHLSTLSPEDIIGFIQSQATKFSRARTKLITTVLRAFLKYARYQGYIVSDLAAAVPTTANWSKACQSFWKK